MQLKLLLISFSLFLISCSGMPTKPVVTLCTLDFPDGVNICNPTDGATVTQVSDLKYAHLAAHAAAGTTAPIATADKNINFSPADWDKIQTYIDALVNYITEGN